MTEELQHHIHCRTGDVARYVLLPGSPERAKKIASFLDDARLVAVHREHAVYTGSKDGVPISVCSTGMGCPSTAIAIEELGKIGADTFIRVGSAGAYQEYMQTGDIVIYSAAFRADGTSATYIDTRYPAVADRHVVRALEDAAADLGLSPYVGIGASGDAFYAKKPAGWAEMLHDANVIAGEMEASTVFVVSSMRKWRSGCIVAIDGNIWLKKKKEKANEHLFFKAEENEIKIAIEACKRLAQQDNGGDK